MITILDSVLENSFLPMYALATIFSLIRYPKYFDTPLKYLPIPLMYTLITEIIGTMIKNNPEFSTEISGFYLEHSYAFYNIYNFIFFLYFYYVFYTLIPSKKEIIKYISYFFIAVSVILCFIEDPIKESLILMYIIGSLILINFIGIYLRSTNKVLIQKFANHSLMYWVSIGMLPFYICFAPILIYYDTADYYKNPELFHNIRRFHILIVDIFYGFIIYGFYQMKNKLKTQALA